DLHRAWLHTDRPYREEDLPRSINLEGDAERHAHHGGAAERRHGGAKGGGDAGAAELEVVRLNGRAARVNGAVSNGKHKNAIQRAIEIEANTEADELGVVAL
ncbi:hypothetical protein MNEG_15279, partial [Monoraphidium neglectum]